jgi:AcrR family transcriptional regulator
MKVKKSSPKLGRPRGFDAEKALNAAMQVFWKKGYEGASLSDLTRAMRIERPSLYASFGNKEALFRKVLDRYSSTVAGFFPDALNQSTARGVAERMFTGAADALTDPRNQAGSLTVQCAASGGDNSEPIRREINRRRSQAEAQLRRRLERAKSEGDLPPDSNPADLTRYAFTITQGIAVQAKAGATRTELRRVAQTALGAWPESPRAK